MRLFLSLAIWEEYTDVLQRPKFRFDAHDVARFLADLGTAATIVTPTKRLSMASDEADNRFLESVQKARTPYLVTVTEIEQHNSLATKIIHSYWKAK